MGISGSNPFRIVNGEEISGLSFDLWKEISTREKIQYQIKSYDSVHHLLEAIHKREIDLGIGPITITSERIEKVAFTQPYYSSYMAILSYEESISPLSVIGPFVQKGFVYGIGLLVFILFLVGNTVYYFERKENPVFQFPYWKSVGNGMWLSIVTFSTVGYGDITVKSRGGRLSIAAWMIVSMISASSLTAGIATSFTLATINRSVFDSFGAIKGKRIASVKGSLSEEKVQENKGISVPVSDIKEAIELLKQKKVDAVISDSPILKYNLNKFPVEGSRLVELYEEKDNYGFALPHGNYSLLQKIDKALLLLDEEGKLKSLFTFYGIE